MYTFILYVHLLAVSISLGILLQQDFALWRSRNRRLTPTEVLALKNTTSIIFVALSVLWLTGFILITLGYLQASQTYFSNEKLWAKLSVVGILTLNGWFLHQYSFPRIIGNSGILQLPDPERKLIACSGALSTTSWLFACYLGIARPWNFTHSYQEIIALYLFLVLGSFITAYAVIHSMRVIKPMDLCINNKADRDAI